MANCQVLLVLCLGMLASLTTVRAAVLYVNKHLHVRVYIPDESMKNVDDRGLNEKNGTLNVSEERVRKFQCNQNIQTVQSMLDVLRSKIETKQVHIEYPIMKGSVWNQHKSGTVTSVDLVNERRGAQFQRGYTADFMFTFALDVDDSLWSPCVFDDKHFGYKHKTESKIYITTKQIVIDDLVQHSEEGISIRELEDDGTEYESVDIIKGLTVNEMKYEKCGLNAYILTYTSLETTDPDV